MEDLVILAKLFDFSHRQTVFIPLDSKTIFNKMQILPVMSGGGVVITTFICNQNIFQNRIQHAALEIDKVGEIISEHHLYHIYWIINMKCRDGDNFSVNVSPLPASYLLKFDCILNQLLVT